MRFVFLLLFFFISLSLFAQGVENRNEYTIPVVFHILYASDEQNISTEQIKAQLNQLNKDFSKTNDNFDSTPSIFKELAADIGYKFCLASIDPDGNETIGITRTETNISEIGLSEIYYETDEGGKDPWNNDEYINIWVADMGDSGILGITPLLGDGSPAAKDGILLNYRFVGVDGEHQDENRNKGKVLTHEMGHYFGLKHIWGSLNTECMDDDDIEDTPLQNAPSFGCPTFPSPDICTQGNGIMFTNFMDYTDDDCLTMFTLDQKDKMVETLENHRFGLIDNSNTECFLSSHPEENMSISIYPNPANEFLYIEFEQPASDRSIQVFNIEGKRLAEWKASQQINQFNLTHFTAGIYYIKMENSFFKIIISP